MLSEDAKKDLRTVVQSSHLNFLLGAGASSPFLPLLGNIEKELNDESKRKKSIYKRYIRTVMLPNKKVIEKKINSGKYRQTKESYQEFFRTISQILLARKSTILSKQANIFTTNIDILMEIILEDLGFDYNDGFSGRFNPTLGIQNYKRTTSQKSLHFDHISEIPMFNIVKLHGSLSWKRTEPIESSRITLSSKLEHISDSILRKHGDEFFEEYKKILVVNPEESKNLASVLNIYYSELLRLYSSELEKENSVLFVIGFSMNDSHVREITLRAAKSNPTLRVYIFCYKQEEATKMKKKMKDTENSNISIIDPEEGTFEISEIIKSILNPLIKSEEIKPQAE